MKSIREEIIEKLLDAKLMTAAGGIFLAGLTGWFYFKTATNHIEHNTRAQERFITSVEKFTDAVIQIQKDSKESLGAITKAVDRNTTIIEQSIK